MGTTHEARAAAAAFLPPPAVAAVVPLPGGHINDTFVVQGRGPAGALRHVLQRINERVFRDPDGVMRNVALVCRHVRAGLEARGVADVSRRCLTLVPTRAGADWHVGVDGGRWRCYGFIEGAVSRDVAETPLQARAAAWAFGRFQSLLADLPATALVETIPRFHDTRSRYADFRAALARDAHGRAAAAAAEVDFALARAGLVGLVADALERGELPCRVTHNDTKLGNVLLDAATHEPLCVIDLDTVMPGSPLYDFGDLVRTTVSPGAEDETDLTRIGVRLPVFAALLDGYLAASGEFLDARERSLLPDAGVLITLEMGLRFLADWLDGDVYYRIARPGHNLDRARAQFALVAALEAQLPSLRALVAACPVHA